MGHSFCGKDRQRMPKQDKGNNRDEFPSNTRDNIRMCKTGLGHAITKIKSMNPEVHHILEKNNIMKNMLAMARYEENSDRYRKMKIVTGLRNIMPITQSFGIRLKVTMDKA